MERWSHRPCRYFTLSAHEGQLTVAERAQEHSDHAWLSGTRIPGDVFFFTCLARSETLNSRGRRHRAKSRPKSRARRTLTSRRGHSCPMKMWCSSRTYRCRPSWCSIRRMWIFGFGTRRSRRWRHRVSKISPRPGAERGDPHSPPLCRDVVARLSPTWMPDLATDQ